MQLKVTWISWFNYLNGQKEIIREFLNENQTYTRNGYKYTTIREFLNENIYVV